MAGINPEKLIAEQAQAISSFFGIEVPKPGDWLFEADAKIRQQKLFKAAPFYLPKRQLAQGISFPGLKHPLDPWLYGQMKAGSVEENADTLPGEWVLFDITKRPDYDNGKQMYRDMPKFRELLAELRNNGENDGILVPSDYEHVPKDSRFAISADEIDGNKSVVAKAVSEALDLKPEQVSTPDYATFNYLGNLALPHLGEANTAEWFRNNFGLGSRLFGGLSAFGGLSCVDGWDSGDRNVSIGFRLQVGSPSKS